MAYTLSNLIRDGVMLVGREASRNITATANGTTTTAICTNLNLRGTDFDDDDTSLVRGTLLVVSTTDGLAPQGEFQRISSYDESSGTITVDTAFSAATTALDRLMIIHPQYEIEEIIELANQALLDLGDMALVDTSITTTSGVRAYDLPVALKRGRYSISYEYDSTSGARGKLTGAYYPAEAGSTGKLILDSDPEPNKSLIIEYASEHPRLSAYSDTVREVVHPSIARWGLAVALLRWQGVSDGMENNKINEAQQKYEIALARNPIPRPHKMGRYFVE